MSTIIHVRLKEPYMGQRDYYSGCLSGIFTVLPPEIVGTTRRILFNKRVAKQSTYETNKCTIERHPLIRKTHTNKQNENNIR